MSRFGLALIALALSSCAKGTGRPASTVVAKEFAAPEGAELSRACVPTGKEICFNATDDNCNGVIDEGCGTTTGVLQFMIAWGSQGADVDLAVTPPEGTRISAEKRNELAGWKFAHDCPKEREWCNGQNTESIHAEPNDPKEGVYTVQIHLAELGTATSPVVVRFGARVGSKTYSSEVKLTPAEPWKVFRLTL